MDHLASFGPEMMLLTTGEAQSVVRCDGKVPSHGPSGSHVYLGENFFAVLQPDGSFSVLDINGVTRLSSVRPDELLVGNGVLICSSETGKVRQKHVIRWSFHHG
ncbi:MAG: hypothetical protein Kow00107_09710 [Planctomycetota bacterium]